MKKKVIITSIVSFVLLLAIVLAGLNFIYTVNNVRTEFNSFTAEGETEARQLQEKLNKFVSSSTVFLNLDEVKSVVEEYPCFRLEEVKKRYPDTLEVKISERKEAFSYQLENGNFAILDEEGEYLYEKESNVNRAGGENILLSGFDFKFEGGEEGKYFSELVDVFKALKQELYEVRANVLHISLLTGGDSAENDFIRIEMREGVVLELSNPQVRAGDKTKLAVDKYNGTGVYEGNGLPDTERVSGRIMVLDLSGDLLLDYQH